MSIVHMFDKKTLFLIVERADRKLKEEKIKVTRIREIGSEKEFNRANEVYKNNVERWERLYMRWRWLERPEALPRKEA